MAIICLFLHDNNYNFDGNGNGFGTKVVTFRMNRFRTPRLTVVAAMATSRPIYR